MKNEIPNWLKYVLIVIAIILMVSVILWVIENRIMLYRQWVKKQKEIRALIYERSKLIRKKLRLDNFAKFAVLFLKLLIVFLMAMFTYYLIKSLKYDPVCAFISAATVFGIIYTIVCVFIYKKVFGINELHVLIEYKVVETVYYIGRLEPARINIIDELIIIKKEEAQLLKKQIQ